jgi:hypothetical protein
VRAVHLSVAVIAAERKWTAASLRHMTGTRHHATDTFCIFFYCDTNKTTVLAKKKIYFEFVNKSLPAKKKRTSN